MLVKTKSTIFTNWVNRKQDFLSLISIHSQTVFVELLCKSNIALKVTLFFVSNVFSFFYMYTITVRHKTLCKLTVQQRKKNKKTNRRKKSVPTVNKEETLNLRSCCSDEYQHDCGSSWTRAWQLLIFSISEPVLFFFYLQCLQLIMGCCYFHSAVVDEKHPLTLFFFPILNISFLSPYATKPFIFTASLMKVIVAFQ